MNEDSILISGSRQWFLLMARICTENRTLLVMKSKLTFFIKYPRTSKLKKKFFFEKSINNSKFGWRSCELINQSDLAFYLLNSNHLFTHETVAGRWNQLTSFERKGANRLAEFIFLRENFYNFKSQVSEFHFTCT